MIQSTGTKSLREYSDRRQATVAEWVSLQPMFEVFAKETGFEGGGGRAISGGVRQPRNGSWRPLLRDFGSIEGAVATEIYQLW